MTIRHLLTLACAALTMPSGSLLAQAAASAPRFIGRIVGVYDERSGHPIDSAEVRDMVGGSSALTTNTGTVSLFFVDTSGSLIRIRKVGYSPVTMFVHNAPGDPPVTVTLNALAQSLPAVVTVDSAPRYLSPGLKGFEERRKGGMGYFISEALMRKEEDRPLANTIRAHIPGVNIVERRNRNQRGTFVMSNRDPNCMVDVYLDGVFLSASGSANDISQFENVMVAGIEFYNVSETPIQYQRTGKGCGVLLIWTRER